MNLKEVKAENQKLMRKQLLLMKNTVEKSPAHTRHLLPAALCKDKILNEIESNKVIIICGAPGCGKSTQVIN